MPSGPALPVILAAGVVHVVRQNLLDVLVFFGTAALIVIDAQLTHRRRPARVLPGPAWVVLAAAGGAALGLTGLGSTTVRVMLAVVGVVTLVVVLRGPGDLTVDPLPRGWPAWAVVAVAIAVWELLAFLSQTQPDVGNPDHPTVSTLADPVMASTLGRSLLFAAWAAGLVWLVRGLATGGTPAPSAAGSDAAGSDAAGSDAGDDGEPGAAAVGTAGVEPGAQVEPAEQVESRRCGAEEA